MIQDIRPHRFQNEYRIKAIANEDYVLFYQKNGIWMKTCNDTIQLPMYKELKELFDNHLNYRYLFDIDGESYFLGEPCESDGSGNMIHNNINLLDRQIELLQQLGYHLEENRIYRHYQPMWKAFACAVGEHLARWYQGHQYCGFCGSHLQDHEAQRALVCNNCGKTIYPTISPCVIVAITDADRILLTRYAHGAYRNYALVAGYAEIGETIEETVHREVYEETGLKVKNLRYYKSQPWSFTDTLLFGFFADLDGSDQVTLQEDELSEAIWCHRSEIPVSSVKLSLTSEMIEVFKNQAESI